jgi:hypothetical protein
MIARMNSSRIRVSMAVALASVLLSAGNARAADDEEVIPDPRYMDVTENKNVLIESPSTAGAYFAVVGASVLVVAVLFKGSGRTHLD